MSRPSLPAGYGRIKIVGSFDELSSTRFADGVNALCWPRELPGDFAEVVGQLGASEGVDPIGESMLRKLSLSNAGRGAVEIVLEDFQRLRALGLAPELNCIVEYPRDTESIVSTDVYSFHADSAPVETDTWLCSYHGRASEGLRNDEAQCCVDIPETRTRLLAEYGGADDVGFREYLSECCYDLHYTPLATAEPFSFGLGHFWRIAAAYPESPVPPCIHRAPASLPGDGPRLLLIS